MHQIKGNLGSLSCPHWHFVTFSDIRCKNEIFRQNVKRIDIHWGHASLGQVVECTLHFLMWETALSWFYKKAEVRIFSNGRRKAAQKGDLRYRETEILRVCETLWTRETIKSDAASSYLKCDLKAWKKASMAYLADWKYLLPWGFTFCFTSQVVPASPVISSVAFIPLFPIFPSPFAVIDACLPSPSLQLLLWKLRKPVRWDGYFLAASFLQFDRFPIFYSLT